MKKDFLIIPGLVGILSLCSCASSSSVSIYNIDKLCYYRAICQIDKPALEDFNFYMPMITNKQCDSISDLKFFNDGQDLDIEVSEVSLVEIYSEKNIDVKDFRYNIQAVLNKNNINNSLHINKITAKINNNNYEFAVDITIEYHYIQEDYQPINCIAYNFERKDNSMGIIYLFTPNMAMAGGKITNIEFRTIDDENVLSYSIKNLSDESIFEIGDELYGQTDYYIEVEFSLDVDYFVASNLYLTVDYGSMTLEYSTNINQTCPFLYSAFLETSNTLL